MVQISRCQQHSTDHSHRETEDKSESTSVRNLFFGPLILGRLEEKLLWLGPVEQTEPHSSKRTHSCGALASHGLQCSSNARNRPQGLLKRQQIWKDIHHSVLSFSAVLPFHNHTAKHEAQESVFHITLRKSSPASFCSASSYWRTRFCPRSCSEKFSTWDAEFCAIKHPCLPPAQWGLRTQLSLALAHGSPVHTSSPLHTSCQRCLVLTKHRPVLLLPLLSAWFGVSELKKKVSLPKKQVTKW